MTNNVNESDGKIVAKHPYFQTFIVLLVLTVIEVAIGYLPSSSLVTLVLLIFALAKVGLVVAIFMHVKYEKNPVLIIIGVFIVPLMAGLILILTIWQDFSPTTGA
jgi:caa(3)-type oxidase subunit IV